MCAKTRTEHRRDYARMMGAGALRITSAYQAGLSPRAVGAGGLRHTGSVPLD